MATNARDFLPLKDLVFRILVALSDGERHGWSLVQALDEPSEKSSADALPPKRGAAPTRFFRLTPLGVEVARAETARLEALVARSRAARLLKARR